MKQAMTADNDFYKSLLDNLYDGVYFVDRDRKITYWNRGAENITGYKSSEVVGKRCSENILMHVDGECNALCKRQCPLAETIANGRRCEEEMYLHHKDGHRVPVLTRIAPITDSNGQVVGAIEVFSDNTKRITALHRIEELEKMALLDPLTELGNRRYAEINLHTRFDELHKHGFPFGVLFVDIDHFKKINDMYGHDVGDKVLKMVAKTLLNGIRSVDTVSRWGGEEFFAIIANIDEDRLSSIANKLRVLVEQSSITTGPNTIQVTVSIGATLAQPDDTEDTLLKRADKLMYRCKTSGRNRVFMKLDE